MRNSVTRKVMSKREEHLTRRLLELEQRIDDLEITNHFKNKLLNLRAYLKHQQRMIY